MNDNTWGEVALWSVVACFTFPALYIVAHVAVWLW